jgi:hypothetical protein
MIKRGVKKVFKFLRRLTLLTLRRTVGGKDYYNAIKDIEKRYG